MIDQVKLDNFVELRETMAECDRITRKPQMTRQDQNRFNYLLQKASILKSGAASAEEIRHAEVNRRAIEMGQLPENFRGSLTREQRAEARMWQEFVQTGKVEFRDEVTGHPIASSLDGNIGSFVPFSFFYDYLPHALKAFDPLFSPDIVTYLETTHGRPIQIPNVSAIDTVASVVTEDAAINEVDTDSAGQAIVRGFAYKTPLWRTSIEAFQDLEASYGVVEMFKLFAAQRIALGAGADLMVGNGISKPTGLITALQATLHSVGRVATGSAENTGGSETGANSVGSSDLAALYYSVNSAYRSSPKCAWLMNDNTAKFLGSIVDKVGHPLVRFDTSKEPTLFGKPVHIAPSMDDIGGSKFPVAFGDLSYWLTRCAKDAGYVRVYKEAPGLVEKGEVGLRAFVRYDGLLMYNDAAQAPPIRLLQNHS